MCGLFGIAAVNGARLSPEHLARAERALSRLAHRGPDATGITLHGEVFMGHRRLSVIDLSEAGRQPMLSSAGDVAITVNGENYNFRDLRDELGREKFRSGSDSEVVLHGYRQWGIDRLCERLDGMYAAVVSDRIRRKLFLFRDRPGIKPLYYGRVGDSFVWASELKAIECFFLPGELTIDPTALLDFLTYRYVPSPKSLYREISKLPPATILEVDLDSGAILQREYWRPPAEDEEVANTDALAEELRGLLQESVREQMVSDVPLGFFLSGGLDSSIITGIAAKDHIDCRAFSIGFDVQSHDETEYAAAVARHFGAVHTRKEIRADDATDLIARMLAWYDEPFADTSALPTYHVSALARTNVTVALSGDGADELFGGYAWYHRFWKLRRLQGPLSGQGRPPLNLPYRHNPSSFAGKAMKAFALWGQFDPLALYAGVVSDPMMKERRRYRQEMGIAEDYDDLWALRRYWKPELSPLKQLQYLDFHTFLPDDILTKVDRVSMAVSLEVRVPYLSRKLIEFAFRMPPSFLMLNGQLKGGLKYAYRDMLPPQILGRRKKGFSIPTSQWKSRICGTENGIQEAFVRAILARPAPSQPQNEPAPLSA